MPSKLDYLSKYTSSGVTPGENEKEKRKKAKKEKKKKKRKTEESKKRSIGTNLVDEDDFPLKGESDDDGDDLGNARDDEGPVVVPSNLATLENDSIQERTPRGVWKTVATTDSKHSGNVSSRGRGQDASSGTTRRRRYDSSSSSEDERVRPRQRYDSSDDEEEASSGARRPRPGEEVVAKRRQRYDSSSDDENNRQPSHPYRHKKRHDSDDENSAESTSKHDQRRRRRHDSSEEEEDVARGNDRKRRRALRHDSSSDDEERNEHRSRGKNEQSRRYDSSSDSENGRTRRRSQRYDSEESDTGRGSSLRRKRHDSDTDKDSSDGDDSSRGEARMSSGHKAGLQNYKDFNKSEQKIQAKKHRDAQKMVDKHGMGETVYRDEDGRKTKGESQKDNQVDTMAAMERLNQGRVQKEAKDARAKELLDLQNSGFARYRDDDKLEQELKNEIRKDDPMAKYAISKTMKQKSGRSQQTPVKPIYKGPPPKANRFGIRPGYRWDGNDRGNGFEDKILAKKFSSNRRAEQSYKWSSADM